MRLQKFMAKAGIASRRKSEKIILDGRVTINNTMIKELGFKVDPKKDIIKVDNKKIFLEKEKIYIILNKPVGYITSVSDQFNRKTVIDLVSKVDQRIYPVGRLDYDTSGLLLLTNDGDLTYKMTHPSHEVNKTYIAEVKGIPNNEELKQFKEGLKIEDYITSPADINIIKKDKGKSTVKITIHEGKNRQVRKMCEKINHPVIKLKRVSFGDIRLNDLREGDYRFLTDKEIRYIKDEINEK
ncbi:pseudouridine synthase [Senegalia massiliensis]|uniref:Pseudouridine synthase n=1 Tax=Senegalia massiliensis TaxID=1720316 RepID=A0A845QVQ5_9CLOT|nr:pseudouridine synthase [Senegalia massiliensis]NBI06605.1 rRNA pseudouridine synthase [Senegalia massiliensis]